MSSNNMPKQLYRGIVIPYTMLEEVAFGDIDLVPPKGPIIDDQGRKNDLSDNEYGLYMSDNESMVDGAYGTVKNKFGIPIQGNLVIGFSQMEIKIPGIAIKYEINTEGIPIRIPRITKYLEGSYNGGYAGNEWIADKVPVNNYRITKISIGKDILHDTEDVEIINGDIKEAKEKTKKIIEMRKYRLESLANELIKMSEDQRRNISPTKMEVLKDIFGPNGVRYINVNNINISTNAGKIQCLLALFYNRSPGTIDYKTLEYIETLKQRLFKLNTSDLAETLNNIILEDLESAKRKKSLFLQKKTAEGTKLNTDSFDNTIAMMNAVLNQLAVIIDKDIANKKQFEEIRNIPLMEYYEEQSENQGMTI